MTGYDWIVGGLSLGVCIGSLISVLYVSIRAGRDSREALRDSKMLVEEMAVLRRRMYWQLNAFDKIIWRAEQRLGAPSDRSIDR